MQLSRKAVANLKRHRAAVREAHGILFSLVHCANINGLLSAEYLNEFKASVGKAGAERKIYAVHAAEALVVAYRSRARALETLLRERGIEPPVPPPSAEACTARRKSTDEKFLGELDAAEIEERAQKLKIAKAMENGSSAAEALEHAGLNVTAASKRRAQRLAKVFKVTGKIHDGRSSGSGAPVTVLTGGMLDLIRTLWMRHKKAKAPTLRLAIERYVEKVQTDLLEGLNVEDPVLLGEILAGTVRIPSNESIRRATKSFGPAQAKIREDGFREYWRQMRPTPDIAWTTHANEEWQIDHNTLDIWAKARVGSTLERVSVYLTSVIDVHARACMAAIVSARYPDAFTTALALRMAILPKEQEGWVARGVPERLVLDNGKDFSSQHVEAFCGALGIQMVFCRPRTPDEKPHVERFFGTIQPAILPLLPGAKHGKDEGSTWSTARTEQLLEVPAVRAEILKWIHEEHHTKKHSATGRPPMEMWVDSVPRVNVPNVRDLDVLLLYQQQRKVFRGVIRMTLPGTERGIYWGPALTNRNGATLSIRYNPDDLLSVYAYDPTDSSFVGELWNLRDARSPVTDATVRGAWQKKVADDKATLKSLDERVAAYHVETARTDRVLRKQQGADATEAREVADAVLAAEQEMQANSPPAQSAAADIARFKAALADPPAAQPIAQPTPSLLQHEASDEDLVSLRAALSA